MDFNVPGDQPTEDYENEGGFTLVAPAPEEPVEEVDEPVTPDTLAEVLTSETVEPVVLRYVGPEDYIKPNGFGKFFPDEDYTMSAKCAKFLLGLKSYNGKPAFEVV